MFGKKKKPDNDLQEIRDLTKSLLGDALGIYVVTVLCHFVNHGNKTAKDVEKALKEMLDVLQKYVRTEIILDRQKCGHEPSLAEIAGLSLK